MITKLGGRKMIVVMFSLLSGTIIAFTCDATILSAYATLASICVGSFMGAHAAQDWKNGGTSAPS